MLLHENGDTFNSVDNALNVATGRMVLKCDAVFVFLVTSSCGNHCGNHEQCSFSQVIEVFGRHFEGSNFRRLLMGRNLEADLPRDEDAALKSHLD